MARGMGPMLDDADLRAVPRNVRGIGGQAAHEAQQVHRDVLGELRRQELDQAVLPSAFDSRSRMEAAQRAVP